jgi:hypothetical protein
VGEGQVGEGQVGEALVVPPTGERACGGRERDEGLAGVVVPTRATSAVGGHCQHGEGRIGARPEAGAAQSCGGARGPVVERQGTACSTLR